MADLHNLPRTTTRSKRPGRGIAAGQGKTAGRGTKGQKARTGANIPTGFEGGQSKLFMRLPKLRGLGNKPRTVRATVTLAKLDSTFANGDVVSLETLKMKGIVSKAAESAKIVGTGTLTKTLKFRGLSFTKSVYAALYGTKQTTRTSADA